MEFEEYLKPDREKFGADPFGYSALGWINWQIAKNIYGFESDISKPPTSEDLKEPVLWMSQAFALSQAALNVLKANPNLGPLPKSVWATCDSQYCAVGLMLVGYSLEISLKAMLIIKNGVKDYSDSERKYRHHRFAELSDFIPDLSEKDKAILMILTQFLMWAGRYPDPGSGRENNQDEIFSLSELHRISAENLFELSARVMNHAKTMLVEGHSET